MADLSILKRKIKRTIDRKLFLVLMGRGSSYWCEYLNGNLKVIHNDEVLCSGHISGDDIIFDGELDPLVVGSFREIIRFAMRRS